jgi:cobalt-zinc-cadmium efflux system outer membrane protein
VAARDSSGQEVRRLSLPDAFALAERKGFDALLAEAAVEGARGDLTQVRHLPNPQFAGAFLRSTSVPAPTGATTSHGYALAAGDQGAVEGVASGKRGLRIQAAEAALSSARSNREDALRTLRFQVAQAYWSVLLAEASERVGEDVARSFQQTFELAGVRRQYGAVSDVDLARVETAKLEAEQLVTGAQAQVKEARATLGALLGGEPLDDVELAGSLEAAIPEWPEGEGRGSLEAEALAKRPDVLAARANLERAEAALDLARRLRLPDVTLSAGYTRQGPDIAPVTPPTLSLGAAFELPVFSQRQGEIARADSERASARIALDRAAAKATADVLAAWAAFEGAREQLGRMQDRLLVRARQARELVSYQYRSGAVSLLDLLDAERTALAVELEHAQDLYGIRVAVAGLEAATGRTVTP